MGGAAVAIMAWRPTWWAFALPLVAVGAGGFWGIAEREAAEREAADRAGPAGAAVRLLRAGQWVAVLAGTGALVVAGLAALGVLLGRIIS